ncbi:tRNA pseudouridine(38-40) synthase TruA [Anaerococcus sp. AGMB00486]|uniref:tRNA pseudouridine synthase A n=2 Tax=Anaerococcus TaxID=165779 RepID=A0ABX2N859_9FIRM|nr:MULTISPECIES: tRNA pseudouridine(38-40) synthase TruA [Anaerococcus]MDY3005411.1 tRNA pseudouridine(38-40) synthase TruA [Anaerococcus porci]MSS77318.1 tRNA pseudouridine(38-40) synthase TruA [Anaerococcus porci]NVF10880.1 tRNA pseudouridine(38-40) synthase TruA [Anaerococcus faecalis]
MSIQNILLSIQYDGTNFSGFQIQENKRTIQECLEIAVRNVTGEKNRIIAAGRTDSGVHANLMYVNFLTATDIQADKFHFHLKKFLPDDILVLSSRKVDKNFHARFSVKTKTYKYVISLEKVLHPIYRNYMENITYKLNFSLLEKGLLILKGEHDFKAFCINEKNDTINTVRTIKDCYFRVENNKLYLFFIGESFLHNQVRIMAGSLIELSRGKISLEDFKNYFNEENTKRANPTLKAGGLYLDNIDYKFLIGDSDE